MLDLIVAWAGIISLVLTIVLLLAALAFVVISLLKNMFRSVFRGGLSLGISLLCIPLAMLIAGPLSNVVTDIVLRRIPLSALKEIAAQLPSGEGAIYGVARMIVAPLIFALVYLLLRIVLAIVGHFVANLVENKKTKMGYKNKAIGAAIGALCGVVLTIVYMMPLASYTGLVGGAIDAGLLEMEIKGKQVLPGELAEDFDKIVNTPVLSVTRALGGKAIFNGLATTKLDGVRVRMGKEVDNLWDLVGTAVPLLGKDVTAWGEEEIAIIEGKLPEAFENSNLLRVLGAEAISGLSNSWLKGEAFLAIKPIEVTGITKSIINSALLTLRDTTKDNITSKLKGLTPMIELAVEAFKIEDGDMTALLNTLADKANTPEIKALLMTAGVSVLADNLGLYNNKEEIYDNYSSEMAALSTQGLTVEELAEQIKKINDKYAVAMSGEEVSALAKAIHANPYIASAPSASMPSHYPVLVPLGNPVAPDLTAWMQQIANEAAKEQESLKWLNEKKEIPTKLMTTEDLTNLTTDVETLEALTKEDIATLVTAASDMIASGESINLESAVGVLGSALGNVAASEKGQELVSSLVTGVLQSEKVCQSMGITPGQATDIANAIKDSGGLKDLNQTASDVTKLMGVINKLSQAGSSSGAIGSLTPDEFRMLIMDMSDASAAMIRALCTPEMLIASKVPADTAAAVSKLLNDLLAELVEARKTWTEEHYQKEADALYRVMLLALGAQNGHGNTFEERFGITPKELIEIIAASELLTTALPDSINELYQNGADPFKLSTRLNEHDREEIAKQILEYEKTAPANAIPLMEALRKMLDK